MSINITVTLDNTAAARKFCTLYERFVFNDIFGNGVSESDFSDFVWEDRFSREELAEDDEELANDEEVDETEFVIDFYEEDIYDEDECDAEEYFELD